MLLLLSNIWLAGNTLAFFLLQAAGEAAGDKGAADSYIAFLKSGGSMYPLDGLKLAGVDMASTEPVESAFAALARTVTRLEELLAAR